MIDHGGAGQVLHWAPANGFPPETYRPILEGLTAQFHCVTLPPRALWPSAGDPPADNGDWSELAVDLVAGIEERGWSDLVAVGHSFGAVASLVAATMRRSLFRALVLLDPVILPTEGMKEYARAKAVDWQPDGHPLARQAIKRRSRFSSREQAFESWRDRRLFSDWSDSALAWYTDGGLQPDGSGGFDLVWSPAWEAYYYRSFKVDTWQHVARLDPALPILLVSGAQSDAFGPEARAEFEGAVPWAESIVLEGSGHLFPQARPQATLAVIKDWLSRTVR